MRWAGLGVTLVLLVVMQAVPAPQDEDEPGTPRLRIDADYAVFWNVENQSYIEVYYALNQEGLTFVPGSGDGLTAAALVRMNLWSDDSLVAADVWRMESAVQDSSEIGLRNMVDALRYAVEPGEYVLKLFARDVNNPANADSALIDISIKPRVAGKLTLSQVELATSIRKAPTGESRVFNKNTLEVIPNPSGLFGAELPILFYYCEAYDLPQALSGEKYRTRAFVTDADGQPVEEIKPRERTKRVVSSSVEVGTINVSALQTGVYFLNLAILDEQGSAIEETSKKFYVYNPDVDRKVSKRAFEKDVAKSVFAAMSEPELDQEYNMIQYILRDSEKKFWQKLEGADAKRNFLFAFWKMRDPEPETPINEMRQEYFKRVEYANQKFRSFSREGWRTDRGRVYIVYGPPDDIDYYPSSEDILPYEIWYYNEVQGGVQFVFVDREGYKEYALVHSDALGEVQNPDWQTWAKRIR
jgi:GWxTD domain-containing protein